VVFPREGAVLSALCGADADYDEQRAEEGEVGRTDTSRRDVGLAVAMAKMISFIPFHGVRINPYPDSDPSSGQGAVAQWFLSDQDATNLGFEEAFGGMSLRDFSEAAQFQRGVWGLRRYRPSTCAPQHPAFRRPNSCVLFWGNPSG
jgi:hypothetical protein